MAAAEANGRQPRRHYAVYRPEALSDALVQRWNELLASASPVRSAFLSHAFCAAVQRTRGGVSVLHIQDEAGGEAFLPYQMKAGRSVLGHAEKVGGEMSDFFGVVGNLAQPLASVETLRRAGLSSLRFDHAVPELTEFGFADLERSRGTRLVIEGAPRWQATLLANNKVFTKSVLAREKRLAAELGPIAFRRTAERPLEALEQLIAAKRAQYQRTGVADPLAKEWRRLLLRDLLQRPGHRECDAVLSTLHAGGEWIASKLCLICNDTLHSWFSVYDPRFRRHGPGHILWFKTIQSGCEAGIRVFDFGEGEANYKVEYGGEVYELWKGVMRRNSLSGRSERVIQSLIWRIAAASAGHKS